MDQAYRGLSGDSIVITGIGISASEDVQNFLVGKSIELNQANLAHDCRPVQYLQQRKTLKFMSKQDRLALEAAKLAVDMGKIPSQVLRDQSGVFLTVGYISFEFNTAVELYKGSVEDNRFSMRKFSTDGIENINPLLAFACLPNMPAHHVAVNLDIQGRYLINYPDCIQMYIALQEAVRQLYEGQIDVALVGGVADQSNFLVQHHFDKTGSQPVSMPLADCAGFITLEKRSSAEKRNANILAHLDSLQIAGMEQAKSDTGDHNSDIGLGPAELVLHIFSFLNMGSPELYHCFDNEDIHVSSTWQKAV